MQYAHSYGIAVNLGYSWGWLNHQCAAITDVSDAALVKMKDEIIRKYEAEYAPTNCDGIYFQSFTERKDEYIGGIYMPQAIYAQMLRSMDEDYGGILQKVGRRFCITVD